MIASASSHDRDWVANAIGRIEADFIRSSDTHLLHAPAPGARPKSPCISRTRSTHPTGSLKHRLARSLFLYGCAMVWIGPQHRGRGGLERLDGCVSEAYFARLLGLRFIAVMPRSTCGRRSPQIAFHGGERHFVDAAEMYAESARSPRARRPLHGPVHLRRAGHGLAGQQQHRRKSICDSAAEPHRSRPGSLSAPAPAARRRRSGAMSGIDVCRRGWRSPIRRPPRFTVWPTAGSTAVAGSPSLIEGIGRPVCEPSFLPELIDRCLSRSRRREPGRGARVSRRMGRFAAALPGTNLCAAAQIISDMRTRRRKPARWRSLICNSGERYRSTHLDTNWLTTKGFDLSSWRRPSSAFSIQACGWPRASAAFGLAKARGRPHVRDPSGSFRLHSGPSFNIIGLA